MRTTRGKKHEAAPAEALPALRPPLRRDHLPYLQKTDAVSDHYILDGKTPVACDLMTWARSMEKAKRHVGVDERGDVRVSTVFLGMNHRYGDGPPLLFETIIFGGEHDSYQERCSTWDEAEKMHATACKLAFGE